MKRTILITFIASLFISTSFKPASEDGIQWVTFEEAIKLSKKKPKKIFVDVYTNWCGWCKKMDKATFQKKEVGQYMNKNYYCVKFNAEGKEDIVIGDKTYKNTGRTHQLSRELLQGKMSYPTVVFLDERFSTLSPVPGYQEPKSFLNIAKYFGENIYKNKTWDEYNKPAAK